MAHTSTLRFTLLTLFKFIIFSLTAITNCSVNALFIVIDCNCFFHKKELIGIVISNIEVIQYWQKML